MQNSLQSQYHNDPPRRSRKDLVLPLIAIALAVCILISTALAVFFAIAALRSDTPASSSKPSGSNGSTGSSPSAPTAPSTNNSTSGTQPSDPTRPSGDKIEISDDPQIATAVQVGGYNVTAVELNYFYIDAITRFKQTYSSYLPYLLNTKLPLSDQIQNQETGATWADYFINQALDNIQSTYAVYTLAMAKGYSLDEEARKSLDNTVLILTNYADKHGYSSVDAYLAETYGTGATVESYRAYYEKCLIANQYYAYYVDSLSYTAEALSTYQRNFPHQFNSYTYAYYYLSVDRFYPEDAGIMGENGERIYSDEEIAAAVAAAKQAAEALAAGSYADPYAFDEAIRALPVNRKDSSAQNLVSSTKYENQLYTQISSALQDWIIGKTESGFKAPTEGQLGVIPNAVGEGEQKVTNGFYVIRFGSVTDNDFAMKNVRHLLVMFKNGNGKTYSDGITSFTDAQKAAAKSTAEALMQQWVNGEATEESFANLATHKSEDRSSAANGGLCENIYPGQMVKSFEAWCFDTARKTGDVAIVETEYGCHILYFVSNTELTYRDHMIINTMREEDAQKWYQDLIDKTAITMVTDQFVNKDYILG